MTGPVFVSTCSGCGYTLASVAPEGDEAPTEAGHDQLAEAHAEACAGASLEKVRHATLADYVSGPPSSGEVARWVPEPAEVGAE